MQDNQNATYRMQKTIRRDTKPSDNMRVKKDEEKVEAKSGKSTRNQNLISTSLSQRNYRNSTPLRPCANRPKGRKVGFENTETSC